MQPGDGFQFKQFAIRDDQCQMKVGTDGVLLGAWVDVTNARHILDIGTGSGLIALMLAQRTPAGTFIEGVEPLEADALQARDNVNSSPWSKRLKIHQGTIQDFNPPLRFDLIVSNPPYYSSSLLPPSSGRASARHTTTLTHVELLQAASRMLTDRGRFAVILPTTEEAPFRLVAKEFNLGVVRSLAFHSRPGKKVERWLFELSTLSGQSKEEEMSLYKNETGQAKQHWSDAYHMLTEQFYL